MILTQAPTYLQMRTVDEPHSRTRTPFHGGGAGDAGLRFALAGVWVYYGIDGYVAKSVIDHTGPSNPLTRKWCEAGAWMVNLTICQGTVGGAWAWCCRC